MPVIHKRIDKKKPGNNGWWSDKERMQAVSAYVVLGSVRLTASSTGIPELTVRKWRMSQWWKDAELEIRNSNKIELSGKINNVVQATLKQLEDRVQNGDFFFNPKTGKWERKPINASVAANVASKLIDKSLILEKEATQDKASDEGLDDRLRKLKEEMMRFAKAKPIKGEIIDVVPVEPVQQALASLQEEGDPSCGSAPNSVPST